MQPGIFRTCLPLLAALTAGCDDEGAPRPHPASHVIRITAELAFDGKPVGIDEIIYCDAGMLAPGQQPTRNVGFRPVGGSIIAPEPGGGAIEIRYWPYWCMAHAMTFAPDLVKAEDAVVVPPRWTPDLTWYDAFDPDKATYGIHYISETALEADNSRLRIVEPFTLTISEHPPTEALIEKARKRGGAGAADAAKRGERSFRSLLMPSMLRIPESEWRNPERAKIARDHVLGKPQVENYGASQMSSNRSTSPNYRPSSATRIRF